MRILTRKVLSASLALIGLSVGSAGIASANLVSNGGFESTGYSDSTVFSGTNTTAATGWTSTGTYVLLCYPTSCDNTSLPNLGGFALAGPANGHANALGPSPNGGNYMGFDADSNFSGSFSQTINGLTPGAKYTLSFYMAGAQEVNGGGPTTESLQVTLGTDSYTTPTISTPSQGFSPWTLYTTTLTANNTTDVLSFLAVGGPSGEPPYALLDGVSLNSAVPEASTWLMIIAGFAGMGAWARARRKAVVAAA